MSIAFYAPLKSPNHPRPSGDRTMARALMAALEDGGFAVTLASELRTRDGSGDRRIQQNLIAQAQGHLPHIIRQGMAEKWKAWITYHNYYKAPDLIGPKVCAALRIPYFIIEASRAKTRLTGNWSDFAARAERACDAAHAIFYVTQRDAEALAAHAPAAQRLIHLRPFLNRNTMPTPKPRKGPMLSVGMMRPGDKFASYTLIDETLDMLGDLDWHLDIVGDGDMRYAVRGLMKRHAGRVQFLGALSPDSLDHVYARAKLLLWPGVNEAFGMTYLEAQAHGVPVVAQDRDGVRDVVATPGTQVAKGPGAMAERIRALYEDAGLLSSQSQRAAQFVQAGHLRNAATQTLMQGLAHAGVTPS